MFQQERNKNQTLLLIRGLISLAVQYLIDAKASNEGLRLTFFNPSTGASKEVLDKDYRPYFFVPHPLTRKDQETIERLGAKTRVEKKREFFTGQPIRVTRVEIAGFFDPTRASRRFETSWESEVPLILGYVYDQGLTFGAPEAKGCVPTFCVRLQQEENKHG